MRRKYLIVGISFCCIVAYYFLFTTEDEVYASENIAEGQYTVYSSKYRYCKYIRHITPFHESDFDSGKAYLYDELEKKIIGSGHIGQVSMEGLSYNEDAIYFKGEGPWWNLPRKIKNIE